MSEYFDMSDFEKKVLELRKKIVGEDGAVKHAVGAAGLALANHAVTRSPTAPVLTGYLRGSWGVYVNGAPLQTATPKLRTGKDRPAPDEILPFPTRISSVQKITDHGIRVMHESLVVFNTPYAVRMHQKFKKPGKYSRQAGNTGAYFLSTKAQQYAKEYGAIIANRIKQWLNK